MADSAPDLFADIVVLDDSAVLLVQLDDQTDGLEGWRLPGDRLRHGEHPEACARRVLNEQLGLEPELVSLADVESVDAGGWQIIFHYHWDADRPPTPGAAIREARFFQLEHLPQMAHGSRGRDVIYRVIMAQTM